MPEKNKALCFIEGLRLISFIFLSSVLSGQVVRFFSQFQPSYRNTPKQNSQT